MFHLSLKSLLLATIAIAAATQPTLANTQDVSTPEIAATAPVAITYVRVADSKSDEARRGMIYLTYRNTGHVAADDVRFAVHHGQATAEIRDLGVFSPDVRIDHHFAGGSAMQWGIASPSSASVVYVHFIDGTSWSAVGNASRRQVHS